MFFIHKDAIDPFKNIEFINKILNLLHLYEKIELLTMSKRKLSDDDIMLPQKQSKSGILDGIKARQYDPVDSDRSVKQYLQYREMHLAELKKFKDNYKSANSNYQPLKDDTKSSKHAIAFEMMHLGLVRLHLARNRFNVKEAELDMAFYMHEIEKVQKIEPLDNNKIEELAEDYYCAEVSLKEATKIMENDLQNLQNKEFTILENLNGLRGAHDLELNNEQGAAMEE